MGNTPKCHIRGCDEPRCDKSYIVYHNNYSNKHYCINHTCTKTDCVNPKLFCDNECENCNQPKCSTPGCKRLALDYKRDTQGYNICSQKHKCDFCFRSVYELGASICEIHLKQVVCSLVDNPDVKWRKQKIKISNT